jgi:hypothetical protein
MQGWANNVPEKRERHAGEPGCGERAWVEWLVVPWREEKGLDWPRPAISRVWF